MQQSKEQDKTTPDKKKCKKLIGQVVMKRLVPS